MYVVGQVPPENTTRGGDGPGDGRPLPYRPWPMGDGECA